MQVEVPAERMVVVTLTQWLVVVIVVGMIAVVRVVPTEGGPGERQTVEGLILSMCVRKHLERVHYTECKRQYRTAPYGS